jgi:hypothetical protein
MVFPQHAREVGFTSTWSKRLKAESESRLTWAFVQKTRAVGTPRKQDEQPPLGNAAYGAHA